MPSRRQILKGALGAGVALAAVCYGLSAGEPAADPPAAAAPATLALFAAVIPVVLDGALPPGGPERAEAIAATVDGVERILGVLPAGLQAELAQLGTVLSLRPVRAALTGVWPPWEAATAADVAGFLERWRGSRFAALRAGYAALHDLPLAAWYAQPRAWPAIGYPGPQEPA